MANIIRINISSQNFFEKNIFGQREHFQVFVFTSRFKGKNLNSSHVLLRILKEIIFENLRPGHGKHVRVSICMGM